MWWLTAVGVVGFAVFLGTAFAGWRQHGSPGTSRTYMIGLFIAGLVLLAVGVWGLAATWGT